MKVIVYKDFANNILVTHQAPNSTGGYDDNTLLAAIKSLPDNIIGHIIVEFCDLPNLQTMQSWDIDFVENRVSVATSDENYAKYIKASIVHETQQRLDDFAKTRNYDGILSACTYATSTVPKFQSEGQYCVNARDATWATLYQLFNDVTDGAKPMPTSFADVEQSLPILAWPL